MKTEDVIKIINEEIIFYSKEAKRWRNAVKEEIDNKRTSKVRKYDIYAYHNSLLTSKITLENLKKKIKEKLT